MKILIDNEFAIIDNQGFRIGTDIKGRKCRIAYHGHCLRATYAGQENFKLITSGHIYILNYNKDTYKPKNALTFEEYKKIKQ